MNEVNNMKMNNKIICSLLLILVSISTSFGQDPFQELTKNQEFLEILNDVRRSVRRAPNSEDQAKELLEYTEELAAFLRKYIEENGDDGSISDFLDNSDEDDHDHDHDHDYSNEADDLSNGIVRVNEVAPHTQAETIRLAECEDSEHFTRNWNNNGLFLSYESYTNLPDQLVIPLKPFKGTYYNSFNSGFGPRWGGQMHMGIDLGLRIGAPVYAAFDGKVRYAKFNTGGYGNLVVVRHCNGLETYYAHLDEISVEPNEMVSAGQIVGLGGTTGRSSGPHLHFEVRYREFAFDPMLFIDKNTWELKMDTLVLNREDFHTLRWRGDSGYSGPSRYTSPRETVHTVKEGETLYSIASTKKMTVEDLLFLNGIHNPDRIFPGQKLKVE